MTEENLNEMIEKYKSEMLKTYSERISDFFENEETEEKKEDNAPNKQVAIITEEVKKEEEIKEEPSEEVNDKKLTQETEGTFKAVITTGEGAYPVENAKIFVGKDDRVVAFLFTDESGETKEIKLKGGSVKDSLNYDTANSVDYYADVFATGFITKRNLPVYVLQDEISVLRADLVPEER